MLFRSRALSVGPDGSSRRPDNPRDWQYSGTWFDPARSGEGWLVQQSGAPLERLTSVVWFTYDLDGQALWLTGTAIEQDGRVDLTLYRTGGTRFGADFDAGDVTMSVFGQLRFDFSDCGHAHLEFAADDARYGAFDRDLVRLTRPDVVSAECASP